MPRVCIIVCTRNRARSLSGALGAIDRAVVAAGDRADCRLILVDNGSTDETRAVFDAFTETATVPAMYVHHPVPGLSGARNEGLARAASDIVVMTDDDCELSADYIGVLVDLHAGFDGPVIIGGRVDLGDPTDLPLSIKTDPEPAVLDGDVHPGAFVIGANFTVNAAAVAEIGGFDTRFGAGARFRSGEDTDYLIRARLAGIPVLYAPSLAVAHFHGRKTRPDVRRLHDGYEYGTGALYAKYRGQAPRFARHLYWTGRSALFELFGGPAFDAALGISQRSRFLQNLKGFLVFWASGLPDDARPVGRRLEAPTSRTAPE